MVGVNIVEDGYRYYLFDAALQKQHSEVSELIAAHLSEPYSIYVYWYFFHQWPQYCFLISKPDLDKIIGVVISKVEPHRNVRMRGYIGMLVIDPEHRGKGMARKLVKLSIAKMCEWDHVDEITLETEVDNAAALHLYELFGFMRSKRMHRYYMNGNDAFRLILPILDKLATRIAFLPALDPAAVET